MIGVVQQLFLCDLYIVLVSECNQSRYCVVLLLNFAADLDYVIVFSFCFREGKCL
jgi:hypothetical protein